MTGTVTDWAYHWLWANAGVGNFAAGAVVTTLATVLIKKLRLHDRARTWLHRPLHDRLDRHAAGLQALHDHLGTGHTVEGG